MKIRINKYIDEKGVCSRRKADVLISNDQVTINGKPAKLGDMLDPANDRVVCCGKDITEKKESLVYWAVYKPVGVVSTAQDEKGRPKVTDLVSSKERLYPTGRLDAQSEGLMVLTNDGSLTHELTHPSSGHIKSYRLVARPLRKLTTRKVKNAFEKGLVIDGKRMKADKVNSIDISDMNGYFEIELDLITGYNRQIRRMCDKIGLEVKRLTRTGIGKLRLKELNLSPGQSVSIRKQQIL